MRFSRQEYWSGVPLPSLSSGVTSSKEFSHIRLGSKLYEPLTGFQGILCALSLETRTLLLWTSLVYFTPQSWQPEGKHCGFQRCLVCCRRGHRQVTGYVSCKCWLACDVCHSYSCVYFWSECNIYRITLYFQLLIGEINHPLLSGFLGKLTRGGVGHFTLQFSAEAAVMSWLVWQAPHSTTPSPTKNTHTHLHTPLRGGVWSSLPSGWCHWVKTGYTESLLLLWWRAQRRFLLNSFMFFKICVFLLLDPGVVIADPGCEILCQCRWFVRVKQPYDKVLLCEDEPHGVIQVMW